MLKHIEMVGTFTLTLTSLDFVIYVEKYKYYTQHSAVIATESKVHLGSVFSK